MGTLQTAPLCNAPKRICTPASLRSKVPTEGQLGALSCDLEAGPFPQQPWEEGDQRRGEIILGGVATFPNLQIHSPFVSAFIIICLIIFSPTFTGGKAHSKIKLLSIAPRFSKFKGSDSDSRVQLRFLRKNNGKFYFPLP